MRSRAPSSTRDPSVPAATLDLTVRPEDAGLVRGGGQIKTNQGTKDMVRAAQAQIEQSGQAAG